MPDQTTAKPLAKARMWFKLMGPPNSHWVIRRLAPMSWRAWFICGPYTGLSGTGRTSLDAAVQLTNVARRMS